MSRTGEHGTDPVAERIGQPRPALETRDGGDHQTGHERARRPPPTQQEPGRGKGSPSPRPPPPAEGRLRAAEPPTPVRATPTLRTSPTPHHVHHPPSEAEGEDGQSQQSKAHRIPPTRATARPRTTPRPPEGTTRIAGRTASAEADIPRWRATARRPPDVALYKSCADRAAVAPHRSPADHPGRSIGSGMSRPAFSRSRRNSPASGALSGIRSSPCRRASPRVAGRSGRARLRGTNTTRPASRITVASSFPRRGLAPVKPS